MSGEPIGRVRFAQFGNTNLQIPSGAARHEAAAGTVLPRDIHRVSGWPHMHWLGVDAEHLTQGLAVEHDGIERRN